MKSILALLLLSLMPLHVLNADEPCKCKDPKAPHHYRYNQKHETASGKYHAAAHPISAADIISWQKKYTGATKALKASPDKSRMAGTPEDTMYTLKGFMWYVKHEAGGPDPDCDFHIEIGPQNTSGKRAVVEVTKDNCNLQQEILDTMDAHGYSLKKEFTKPIPCTVTGLGFYDGVHPPSGHGRRGKTTFSSWELHPVINIKFN
jgi:hypothetical protein